MPNHIRTENVLKEFGEIKLVGFRVLCEGDAYQKEIPKAAKVLEERVNEIRYLVDTRQIGAFKVETQAAEEDGYWIGVPVSRFNNIPDGMVALTIPSHKYASFMHNGPKYDIGNSYQILHQWIAEHGLTRATNNWSLEFYQMEEISSEELRVELCDAVI
jgi:predicted transcriptional regulator YdeE